MSSREGGDVPIQDRSVFARLGKKMAFGWRRRNVGGEELSAVLREGGSLPFALLP